MKKASALLLAAIMIVAAFAGCSTKEKTSQGGMYRDYVNAAPTTLNTHVSTDATTITRPLTTSLYRDYVNETGDAYETRCMLAADFPKQMDEEGKVWQIPIRQDYYWADYGPTKGKNAQMNADTVIYSYKKCLDPELLNVKASLLTNNSYLQILNAYEYQQSMLEGSDVTWEDVGLKKIDEFTIEVTTVKPTNAIDVANVIGSYVWGYMIYEPLFEACTSSDGSQSSYGTSFDKWASSGEYMLSEWIPDSRITMIRNPNYVHADEIKLGGIVYNVLADSNTAMELFKKGELDHLNLVYQQWEEFGEDPRIKLYYNDSVTYVFVNNGNPKYNNIMGDVNFRQAIYYGLDRAEFATTLEGFPNTRLYRRCVIAEKNTGKSILTVPVDWADDPNTVYDKAKANQLLAKAYEKAGITGGTFEVYYSESGTHTRSSVEIFQKQMVANLNGIKMTIRAVPSNIAYSLRRWNPDDPDAYDFNLGSVLPSNNPLDTMKFFEPNYTSPQFYWGNMPEAKEKMQDLYSRAEQAVRDNNEELTVSLCLEMEKLLVKELYIRIPVYELPSKAIFSDRVKLPVKEYINSFGFGEYYAEIVEK